MAEVWDVVLGMDGAHEEIGEEAEAEKGAHESESAVISFCLGNTGSEPVFGEPIDEGGADNRRHAPRGDKSAVDGTYLVGAEKIAQISGNGCEAASVHADDSCGTGDEEGSILGFLGVRKECVERYSQDEIDTVNGFAACEI